MWKVHCLSSHASERRTKLRVYFHFHFRKVGTFSRRPRNRWSVRPKVFASHRLVHLQPAGSNERTIGHPLLIDHWYAVAFMITTHWHDERYVVVAQTPNENCLKLTIVCCTSFDHLLIEANLGVSWQNAPTAVATESFIFSLCWVYCMKNAANSKGKVMQA